MTDFLADALADHERVRSAEDRLSALPPLEAARVRANAADRELAALTDQHRGGASGFALRDAAEQLGAAKQRQAEARAEVARLEAGDRPAPFEGVATEQLEQIAAATQKALAEAGDPRSPRSAELLGEHLALTAEIRSRSRAAAKLDGFKVEVGADGVERVLELDRSPSGNPNAPRERWVSWGTPQQAMAAGMSAEVLDQLRDRALPPAVRERRAAEAARAQAEADQRAARDAETADRNRRAAELFESWNADAASGAAV